MRAAALLLILLGATSSRSAVLGPRATDRRNDELLVVAEEALAVGDAGRALEALAGVDEGRRTLDRARFLRLRGRCEVEIGAFDAALRDLAAAAAPEDDATRILVDVARARAEAGRGHPARCAEVLARAPAAAFAVDDTVLLASRCAADAGYVDGALAVLEAPLQMRPASAALHLQRARLRIGAGAPGLAAADVDAVVDEVAVDDGLDLAARLDTAGARRQAAALLEALARRFPTDARVRGALARANARRDPRAASAQALDAAMLDPARAADAAQLLRDAAQPRSAAVLAGLIPDRPTRLRQRLALLVDAHAWDRVIALTPRLQDAGLLAEDHVRYAVAWARAAVGDLDGAESLLDAVKDAAVFERATSLRASLAACRAAAMSPTTEDPCPH